MEEEASVWPSLLFESEETCRGTIRRGCKADLPRQANIGVFLVSGSKERSQEQSAQYAPKQASTTRVRPQAAGWPRYVPTVATTGCREERLVQR